MATFDELTDTPANKAGQDHRFVRVKPDESGLEYIRLLDSWSSAPYSGTIFAGLNADRPAAGISQRYYWATDNEELWYDNGTTWARIMINHLVTSVGIFMGNSFVVTDQEIELLQQPANYIFAGPVSGADAEPVFRAVVDADVPATHAGSAHHSAITLAADADALLSLSGQELGFDTQSANVVLAGPASGGAVDPTFRALVDADLPIHDLTAGHDESGLTDGHFLRATGATTFAFEADYYNLEFIIDGGGAVITTGQKGHLEIPADGAIEGWTILADQSGSIVVDVWKDTYANFPPTVADTIAGTEKPTLSSVQKNQDLTLTTWTTTVTRGDIIAFNVDSATTVERVTVSIRVRKT